MQSIRDLTAILNSSCQSSIKITASFFIFLCSWKASMRLSPHYNNRFRAFWNVYTLCRKTWYTFHCLSDSMRLKYCYWAAGIKTTNRSESREATDHKERRRRTCSQCKVRKVHVNYSFKSHITLPLRISAKLSLIEDLLETEQISEVQAQDSGGDGEESGYIGDIRVVTRCNNDSNQVCARLERVAGILVDVQHDMSFGKPIQAIQVHAQFKFASISSI